MIGWGLLIAAFVYRPDLLKWWLRSVTGWIEGISDAVPYPWGETPYANHATDDTLQERSGHGKVKLCRRVLTCLPARVAFDATHGTTTGPAVTLPDV